VHNFNERSGTGYAGAAAFGTLHAVELTPRQADVLLLIRNHKHLHGYSPSIREIASMLSISRATVMAHLERMEKKNLIRRKPGAHRTLEVVADVQGVTPRETPRERKKAAAPPPPKEQSSLDWLRSTG
jgi:repressor LexA